MTERFNSGELRIIFRVNVHKFLIGLTIVGKYPWQQEEERKGDISTALIFQEQSFISELFKDIQDATLLILSTTTIPMQERRWIDIEPSEQTLAAYDLSKKVISLLRHNQTVQREEDGAVQFWRIKFHLRNHSSQVQHWSDERWKSYLAAGGGSKRRYQYCSDISGTIVYFRALQGHSGRSLVDPTLQDNVLIQSGFFQHIYHIECAFNLHSIINNGLIPGGQDSSRRQTVFFLPIDPRDKDHEDPEHIDFSVPRRAR